jgi:carboxyl-terminal processing protease
MEVPPARNGNFGKRIARILKWAVVSSVAILAAVLAISLAISLNNRIAFEKLPARERHLVIYDAFCAQIRQHYFDPNLSGVDWSRIDQEWREKAAAASSDLDLYVNVLENIGRQFPASHIALRSPSKSPAKPPIADALTAKDPGLISLFRAGPGFDDIMLRRGTRTGHIVGDIVPGSAAERAGIMPGWRVLDNVFKATSTTTVHFTGEFVRLTPDQSSQLEREGTTKFGTTQKFDDNVAANTIKLEYDLVPLPTPPVFETKRLLGGSSYIRFNSFLDSKLIDQALAALDQAGPEGVVIDLRRNIGGHERELKRFLDRVLKNDSYIGAKRSAAGVVNCWRTANHGSTYSGPLVVLIGPITGSAAEIVAAAIKDNARGRLLGRMSNGSVLEGQVFPLPDGGQVQVPVSDFVRAGGRRIEGVGVEPDIRVIPSLAEIRGGRDSVVERAALELRNSARGATLPVAAQ